jgi:hypothetical protein
MVFNVTFNNISAISWRFGTDNTTTKRTNNELQNITHKTKDRITGGELRCSGRAAVPAPPVVLIRCLHAILILPNVYIDPTLLYRTASLYLFSTSQENIPHNHQISRKKEIRIPDNNTKQHTIEI